MTNIIIAGVTADGREHDVTALGVALARLFDGRLVLTEVGGEGSGSTPDALTADVPEDVEFDVVSLESEAPVAARQVLAERDAATVVVMGRAHHQSAGSDTVLAVPHDSPSMVAIAPPGYASRPRPGDWRVGVAWDGSDEAVEALAEAADVLRRRRGVLRVLHVARGLGSTTAGVLRSAACPVLVVPAHVRATSAAR